MAAGPSSSPAAKRGGVVVRHAGTLRFLPASVVARISSCPPISRVPGAPKPMLGIAYDEGEIVPVIALEPDGLTSESLARRPLVVCRYLGEPVGLAGCEVVETGMFDADPNVEGAVIARGGPARSLDLAATFASLRGSHWTVAEG
jgi:hypothetical protein